jgi:sortase A
VIGDISIPELQINLPIFKGVDSRELLFGAGTLKENEQMGQGNYALASHHIVGQGGDVMLFSPLTHAQIGQAIFITDKVQVWEYKINHLSIVSSHDTHDMNDIPHQKLITLVTCEDLTATHRIIVQGQLVHEFSFDEKVAQVDFSETYHQYD